MSPLLELLSLHELEYENRLGTWELSKSTRQNLLSTILENSRFQLIFLESGLAGFQSGQNS